MEKMTCCDQQNEQASKFYKLPYSQIRHVACFPDLFFCIFGTWGFLISSQKDLYRFWHIEVPNYLLITGAVTEQQGIFENLILRLFGIHSLQSIAPFYCNASTSHLVFDSLVVVFSKSLQHLL